MAGIYPAGYHNSHESSLHAGPGFRLVRLHQERAARRLLRAEHDRPLSPQLRSGQLQISGGTPIGPTLRAWAISCCRSATRSPDGPSTGCLGLRRRQLLRTAGHRHLRRLVLRRRRDLQEPGLPARRLRRHRQRRQRGNRRLLGRTTRGHLDQPGAVQSNLAAHLHNTARSETLYAILVEGVGPLGSVFNRDDFSDREVKDTDGDGLPEFVDAWGQPLQFFRWPLLYHTDTQRGQVIDYWDYTQRLPLRRPSSSSTRPTARSSRPASRTRWTPTSSSWRRPGGRRRHGRLTRLAVRDHLGGPAGSVGGSGGVLAFEYFFHRLTEPLAAHRQPTHSTGTGVRLPFARAFFSKPLILSPGPTSN